MIIGTAPALSRSTPARLDLGRSSFPQSAAAALGPLLIAGVVTLELCVFFDLPLNFANIIALPLLLGVGVAFKIYYVEAWWAGPQTAKGEHAMGLLVNGQWRDQWYDTSRSGGTFPAQG